MANDSFKVKKSIQLEGNTTATADAGQVRYDSANNVFKAHDGTTEEQVIRAGDAAALTYDNATSGLAATDIQSAVDEVDGDLDAHIADAAGAHAASAVSNAPSGNLAATDVQAALDELQTDVDTRALDSDLTTHMADTTTHGVTGDVVGTTDTQTLSGKTISGASNTLTVRDGDIDSEAATANYVLTADGSSGASWAAVTAGSLSVVSKTAAYTAISTDDVILCDATSAAFTITLPVASSNTGKVYRIKKTDSSDNAVTIDGNSTETIDGSTTFDLVGQYDELTIVSDGSNWVIESYYFLENIVEASNSTLATWSGGTAWTNLDSLSLTRGKWELESLVNIKNNGTVTDQNIFMAISENSGTTTTDHVDGENLTVTHAPRGGLNGFRGSFSIPKYTITVTATTTYYLKLQTTASATNIQTVHKISARRVG